MFVKAAIGILRDGLLSERRYGQILRDVKFLSCRALVIFGSPIAWVLAKRQNQVTRKCGAGDVLLDSSLTPPSPIMPQDPAVCDQDKGVRRRHLFLYTVSVQFGHCRR